jgi:hypothetical protein
VSRQLLDEDVPVPIYHAARQRVSQLVQVGDGWGQRGWTDDHVLQELRNSRATFHTLDADYFMPHLGHPHTDLRHPSYCLVYYDLLPDALPEYLPRFLHHPSFRTHAQRMGRVIKVTVSQITAWPPHGNQPEVFSW